MKKWAFVAAIALLASCNNDTNDTSINRDSINNTTDHTKTVLDTIPTGGDTTSYNRMNDHIPVDTMP